MIVSDEKDLVLHPYRKIRLMNGNELECFPKEIGVEAPKPDKLELDTTGLYFSSKGIAQKKSLPLRKAPWEELFYEEAFFLYEHRDAIYADSRMFLTPLPFENNLAYTGTSGLRGATLGVYLEWWDAYERAVLKDGDKVVALTFYIAGSPLSGRNVCSVVDRDGRQRSISFPSPFSDFWKSFMSINQRYAEAKGLFQAYTLEETVSKLRQQ